MELMMEQKYRHTDIGIIPEDWEVKELGGIVLFINGKAHENYISEFGNWFLVNSKFISTEGGVVKFASHGFCPAETGDILMVMSDVPNGRAIAKCFLVGKNGQYTVNQRVCILRASNDDPLYLFYTLNRNKFYLSFDDGVKQTNLRRQDVLECRIALPTIKEQTAIATALSDNDALIAGLEKLIEKKRNVKQGAMQELLRPKDGWVVNKIGALGRPYGGLSGKSKPDFADGQYPYIPFMNIMSNPVIDTQHLDYVNVKSGENQNKAIIGDLFFNGSSETPEEVGMCSVLLAEIPNLYLNSFCFGFRLFKELNNDGLYLSYFFRSAEGRKLFYSSAQGATRYNLSKGNFMKLEISLPTPTEQRNIARVIFDMDAEIQALERKLEKYKEIKHGMMQVLLTGKVRLV